MTRFQRWMLHRIAQRIVIQGPHTERIVDFYKILIHAARHEFTEDSPQGLNSFLTECHEKALHGGFVPNPNHRRI